MLTDTYIGGMSKTNKTGGAAKGGPSSISKKVPTMEDVIGWVRKDLQSAHYLLGIVLMRHPELVDEIGRSVYETVMRKEQGPAIDHVDDLKKEAEGYAD